MDETTELEHPRYSDPTHSDAVEEELLRRISGHVGTDRLPDETAGSASQAQVTRLQARIDDLERRHETLERERVRLECALRDVQARQPRAQAIESFLRPEDALRRAEAAERALAMAQDEIEQLNHRVCLLEQGLLEPGSTTSDNQRTQESNDELRLHFSERERELVRREDQAKSLRDELARRGEELAAAERRQADHEARIRELELRLAEAAAPLTDVIPLTEVDPASGPIGFDGGPDDLDVSMDVPAPADPTEPYESEPPSSALPPVTIEPEDERAAQSPAQQAGSRALGAFTEPVELIAPRPEPTQGPAPTPTSDRPPADRATDEAGGSDASEPATTRDDPVDAVTDLPHVEGYVVERRVERTVVGEAFLGRDESTRRPVTLRTLAGPVTPQRRRRLDAMTHLRHANLFNALGAGECDAGPYLVTERPTGETAQAWLDRVGALPEHSAVAVVLQAARGLRQAAFHSVVHADLSPSTLRIDATGRVRVEGVGLAGLDPSPVNVPLDARYAAPERLRGSPPPDARSDIYSLGAVLYALLCGVAPYEGDTAAVQREQNAAPFPDVRTRCPEVTTATAQLIARMTDRDPDRRPADWDQAMLALERRAGGPTKSDAEPLQRALVWLQENPAALAGLVAAPLLLLVILLLLLF